MRPPNLLLVFLLSAACLGRETAPYRSGSVARPDGTKIAYYLREGPGPVLLLIPGSWGDYRVFDRLVQNLSPRLRILIVELRGHGGSQPASLSPSMPQFAEDVLSVADALALDRFFVSGHSIGGMLTIEILGRRPHAVLGAIPLEGWTHHIVATDAFGGRITAGLSPEQEKENALNRERVRSRLSPAEIDAFAAVWKQWDGLPILERTDVPILEVWGDRGLTRPGREKMRIPARPNIELVWMENSSHSLLIQCPESLARVMNDFIDRVQAARMFAVAGSSPQPRLQAELFTVYRSREGRTGFNMHPYLAWFDNRFWAMWSCNRIRDLQAGQYVRCATSRDGIHWSESSPLMRNEEAANRRFFARGFWVREGQLIALAARDEAVRPLFGPGLQLLGYRWNGQTKGWDEPILIAPDTINNYPPRRLPSGEWMMARRDHRMKVSMLVGGLASPSEWKCVLMPAPPSGVTLDEPEWWSLPDGTLAAAFRDGAKSRRLYRSLSRDGGASWSVPVQTDFPDATAKFNVLRLGNGWYALASNPNPSGKRIPICLSLSSDGLRFLHMAILREEPTIYRYAGKDPGYAGYHYPHLLEQGGYLYMIHAENMEDIRLLRIPLPEIARLTARPVSP